MRFPIKFPSVGNPYSYAFLTSKYPINKLYSRFEDLRTSLFRPTQKVEKKKAMKRVIWSKQVALKWASTQFC